MSGYIDIVCPQRAIAKQSSGRCVVHKDCFDTEPVPAKAGMPRNDTVTRHCEVRSTEAISRLTVFKDSGT